MTDKRILRIKEEVANNSRRIDALREREFHSSVFQRRDAVISRGESEVIFIPPIPKFSFTRISDGKVFEFANLPENDKNDDWDLRIVAAYINNRLCGESKQ